MITKISDRYQIGFWNYSPASEQGAADVADWEKLGMTFVMSPQYNPKTDAAKLREVLDACAEKNIAVILNDPRARWGGAATDTENYRAKYAAALRDFGSHPAVRGFHVGDEPNSDAAFADAQKAMEIQSEMAPNLLPHLNYLPFWGGQEQTFAREMKLAEEAKAGVLCYDCYSQMNPGDDGVNLYYRNLRMFAEEAEKRNIAPWTTLLCIGHFRYRVTKEDDLRWQLSTAAACGMKGILWFYLYCIAKSNYRSAPFDVFGEKTETFGYLSRVNRMFLHQFGDFFANAVREATYMVGKSYGGYPLFENGKTDVTVLEVQSRHNLPALISFFTLNGKRYAVLVNNSPFESGQFGLVLPKAATFKRLSWDGEWEDLRTHHHDALYSEAETTVLGGDWLAPGQMQVYEIEMSN